LAYSFLASVANYLPGRKLLTEKPPTLLLCKAMTQNGSFGKALKCDLQIFQLPQPPYYLYFYNGSGFA